MQRPHPDAPPRRTPRPETGRSWRAGLAFRNTASAAQRARQITAGRPRQLTARADKTKLCVPLCLPRPLWVALPCWDFTRPDSTPTPIYDLPCASVRSPGARPTPVSPAPLGMAHLKAQRTISCPYWIHVWLHLLELSSNGGLSSAS